MPQTSSQYYASIIQNQLPTAVAVLQGAPDVGSLEGTVSFYQTERGVLVTAAVRGLPVTRRACAQPILALHIHNGTSCSGTKYDAFANAQTHYNPGKCPHPYHAGDLPPLFATSDGFAWMACLSDRFRVQDILGRTVILHDRPDDFTSQPSGNAGSKIACGVISSVHR